MKNIIAFFAFTLLLTNFTNAQSQEYSFMESFEVKAPSDLSIISRNSDVEVISHSGDNIEVYYTVLQNGQLVYTSKDKLAKLMKRQAKLEINKTDNDLRIVVRSLSQTGYVNPVKGYVINFRILVPATTTCELISSEGHLSISGLTPNQKCITREGDIKLADIKGNVIAKTKAGDIYIDNIDGRVASETTDGSVVNSAQVTR
ncbi:MAG: hypothetical protein ACI8XB_001764 [Patiriisocius sp.]|jgi:hypothetical protein